MKKNLCFGLLAMMVSIFVQAQTTVTVTRTITAADTISWANVASNVKGLQYTYTETSGTTAGKVILEGTINGTWVPIDSITLADNATAQTLYKAVINTNYKGYRFRNTNTSSATGGVVASYLRRTDEFRQ
jgi:hypothetical protein